MKIQKILIINNSILLISLLFIINTISAQSHDQDDDRDCR